MSVSSVHGGCPRRRGALPCGRDGDARADGDPQSPRPDFVELYRQHERRIYSYCYRHLGNRADAEDATQETFARAAIRLPGVSGDAAPYLSAIAHNVCYDARIARQRRQSREAPLDSLDRAAIGCGPEETTADRSVLVRILTALNGRQRAMLVQTYAGYSYEEIAARMGLTVKVVSVSIVRARQHLRRIGATGLTAIGAAAMLRRLGGRVSRQAAATADRLQAEGLAALQQAAFVAASLALLAVAAGSPLHGATAVLHGRPSLQTGAQLSASAQVAPAPARRTGATPAPTPAIRAALPPVQSAAPPPATLPWLAEDQTEMTFTSFTASPSYSSDHTVFATGWVTACQAQCGVLFSSTDAGRSWRKLSSALLYIDGPIVLLPSFPAAPQMLAATSIGLQRSDDGGRSFAPVVPVPSAVAARTWCWWRRRASPGRPGSTTRPRAPRTRGHPCRPALWPSAWRRCPEGWA
jgi:RNA polymerase sigma-70 factor (ECF subfamily)